MKNLKVNKEVIKKLGATALIMTTLTNFAGCSFSQKGEPSIDNTEGLESVVVDNKVIKIADLKLKDTKTGNVVDTIDKVVIDNKLVEYTKLADVLFNSEIKSVLIGDELVPVSRLVLVDAKTDKEIKAIDYIIDGDELVPAKNLTLNGRGDSKEETTSILEQDEDYEDLTTEKFEELAAKVYKKYSDEGLDVSKENVVDYVMFTNIDKLARDNNELIATIIGERNVDEVVLSAFNVYSAIMTENNNRYCAKGLGWDSVIGVSDTVFDKPEKAVVEGIESRIGKIVSAKDNPDEFNQLLNALLMDMITATEDEFNMDCGVGYSVVTILMNFVRINNFPLDATNSELIKYVIVYAGDGATYEENARSTAYYRGIYNLMTDDKSCSLSK